MDYSQLIDNLYQAILVAVDELLAAQNRDVTILNVVSHLINQVPFDAVDELSVLLKKKLKKVHPRVDLWIDTVYSSYAQRNITNVSLRVDKELAHRFKLAMKEYKKAKKAEKVGWLSLFR